MEECSAAVSAVEHSLLLARSSSSDKDMGSSSELSWSGGEVGFEITDKCMSFELPAG